MTHSLCAENVKTLYAFVTFRELLKCDSLEAADFDGLVAIVMTRFFSIAQS